MGLAMRSDSLETFNDAKSDRELLLVPVSAPAKNLAPPL